jgi:hypothetical protein
VDGTGSGSCPVVLFGISGVEPSGSATRESFSSKLFNEFCSIDTEVTEFVL